MRSPFATTLTRLTRTVAAVAMAAVTVAGLTVVGSAPAAAEAGVTVRIAAPSTVDPSADAGEYDNRVLFFINKQRRTHGLTPVRLYNSCLNRFAARWSRHLSSTEEFYHQKVRRPLYRCDLWWVGENLGRGSMTPKTLVQAWMDSPKHREILLKERATRAGISTTYSSGGTRYTALLMGDHD